MQLNSYIFILAFLPVFLLCYFLLNRLHHAAGKLVIIAAGIVFYLYGEVSAAAIFGASILVNFLLALALSRVEKGKRPLLAFAIALNVALLFYFKYSRFTVSAFAGILGQDAPRLRDLALPLGISFFTFQQIMYLVSVCRKEIRRVNVIDYLAYILYFPKLIMGPLMEPKDFIDQLNDPARRRFRPEGLTRGLKLFSLGLFKKMLLADTFAKAVAWGFAHQDAATSGDLFLVTLCYTFEIYFDFSGYSDMATGIAEMMNLTLPINFDSPYKALSIRDFWKRWHISLTGFLTKYIYIPLGGSRKGEARTYLNILIVFLISGIWHGANWTFLLWGLIHGLLQILERRFHKQWDGLHSAFRWICTFLAVNLLWLLFRADSVTQWGALLGKMFSFQNMSVSAGLIQCFSLPESGFLLKLFCLSGLNASVRGLFMLAFLLAAFVICLIPENNYRAREKHGAVSMVICAVSFVWAFLCLSSESVFVYFNF